MVLGGEPENRRSTRAKSFNLPPPLRKSLHTPLHLQAFYLSACALKKLQKSLKLLCLINKNVKNY